MKKFLLSMVAMLITVVGFAQGTLVATLTHGEEIKMYYGTYAFQQAMNDADHGDVINLSGGTFVIREIDKAITLRGTGVDVENPTTFIGYLRVSIPSDVTDKLCIEGCRFERDKSSSYQTFRIEGTTSRITFIKDDIEYIEGVINGLFTNCNINRINMGEGSSVQVLNSFVESIGNALTAKASFANCVITNEVWSAESSLFLNCIFGHVGSALPESSYAINCLTTGDTSYVFNHTAESRNCYTAENGYKIFIDSNPENDLTDEAKELYLGDDGTPVGMYGGSLPYTLTPSYPRITKMNVATRTTADGKLSVDIEVSAAE